MPPGKGVSQSLPDSDVLPEQDSGDKTPQLDPAVSGDDSELLIRLLSDYLAIHISDVGKLEEDPLIAKWKILDGLSFP